ncbi:MAG: CPBP family intramembrane metalloprotease [Clostridiales bacterium]|nr:CPBP family intramembrane metalloprotease [Clostridiales bacterium]
MEEKNTGNFTGVQAVFRKPWAGIIWFVIVMVGVIFGCSFMQYYWGMVGLALTELFLLIMAVIPVIISKQKWSDVFPIKKPSVRGLLGVFLMWIGTFMIVTVTNVIIMVMFPQSMSEVSEILTGMFTSVAFIPALLIVAVLPAICEEALHRGFILSTMKSIKKDWVVVMIMGLIFGLFHLDPVRFLGTALLGATLTYIMLKTKNIVYPALLHMTNNVIPLVISFALFGEGSPISTEAAVQGTATDSLMTVGAVTLFACAAPLFIAGGAALLRKKISREEDPEGKAAWNRRRIRVGLIAAAVSGAMFVTGLGCVIAGVLQNPPIMVSESIELTEAAGTKEYTLNVEEARTYNVQYNISADKGLVCFEMVDEQGVVVIDFCTSKVFGSGSYDLEPGTYRIIVQVVPSDIRQFYEKKGYDYPDGGFPGLVMPNDENDPVSITLSVVLM